jgi:hypothetical protein
MLSIILQVLQLYISNHSKKYKLMTVIYLRMFVIHCDDLGSIPDQVMCYL